MAFVFVIDRSFQAADKFSLITYLGPYKTMVHASGNADFTIDQDGLITNISSALATAIENYRWVDFKQVIIWVRCILIGDSYSTWSNN